MPVISPPVPVETAGLGTAIGTAVALIIGVIAHVLESSTYYGGDEPGANCDARSRETLKDLSAEVIAGILSRRSYPCPKRKRFRRYKPSTRNNS